MDKKHFYRVGSHSGAWDDLPTDPDELDSLTNSARKHIEPWLSAVFQAEHLNLLLGRLSYRRPSRPRWLRTAGVSG